MSNQKNQPISCEYYQGTHVSCFVDDIRIFVVVIVV